MNSDYLKEALKKEIEIFKIYILIEIALITGIGSMMLSGSFNKNNLNFLLFIIGLLILIAIFISLITSIKRKNKYLNFLRYDLGNNIWSYRINRIFGDDLLSNSRQYRIRQRVIYLIVCQ